MMTMTNDLGDIGPVLERHNKYYEEKLKEFVQEDTMPPYFRDDVNDGRISFSMGQILFIDKGCIPWEKLTVRHENPREYMKTILEKLGLKRFSDQGAPGFGLWVGEDEFGKKAVCFVNPDFPDGYWENHTLEGKLK